MFLVHFCCLHRLISECQDNFVAPAISIWFLINTFSFEWFEYESSPVMMKEPWNFVQIWANDTTFCRLKKKEKMTKKMIQKEQTLSQIVYVFRRSFCREFRMFFRLMSPLEVIIIFYKRRISLYLFNQSFLIASKQRRKIRKRCRIFVLLFIVEETSNSLR